MPGNTSHGGIRKPSLPDMLDAHAGGIGDALRRPVGIDVGQVRYEKEWSFPGAIAVLGPKLRYLPWWSGRLLNVVFHLDTTGSTSSTFKVYKNGTAMTPLGAGSTTITLSSSTNLTIANFGGAGDHGFVADVDYIQVEIVTAGTGAKDLVIQARWG